MLAVAAEPQTWQGAPLAEYLDSLSTQGLRIIYSSNIVGTEKLLHEEPDAANPAASLGRILRPHGMKVVDGPSGSLLVVRDDSARQEIAAVPSPEAIPLPEIVVTSSLHQLQYAESGSHTYMDRDLATRIPAVAEEAVRLTNRLPGTANGGVSSRNHIRGGEVNEVLFLFDGLRLTAYGSRRHDGERQDQAQLGPDAHTQRRR